MNLYQVTLGEGTCISPTASIIGKVTFGDECSVFDGATIRCDSELPHRIGARTNIQENCIIHVTDGVPLSIGEGVTLGHGAIVHGATVGDGSLIGMGAIVLDHAVIGKDCLIGAGSVVTGGTVIPDGHMALGSPARVKRALSKEEIQTMCHDNATHYVNKGKELASQGLMYATHADIEAHCRVTLAPNEE